MEGNKAMMLTDAMKADGWVEHDGGPCPVPLDTIVTILIGDGNKHGGWRAGAVVWPHDAWIAEAATMIPHGAKVLAYKPEAGNDPHR